MNTRVSFQSTDNANARPLVSVTVCTFKRRHIIKHMLDGLTRQTYKNFELVIVLKPSGDGTEQFLKKGEGMIFLKWSCRDPGFVNVELSGCIVLPVL